MQDSLQITLLVLGLCAIVGVFLHGLWSTHKERSARGNLRGQFPRADKQRANLRGRNGNIDEPSSVGVSTFDQPETEGQVSGPSNPITDVPEHLSTSGVAQHADSSDPKHAESSNLDNGDEGDAGSHQLYANVVVKPKPEMTGSPKRKPSGLSNNASEQPSSLASSANPTTPFNPNHSESISDNGAQWMADDPTDINVDEPPPPSFLLKTEQSSSASPSQPWDELEDCVDSASVQKETGREDELPEFSLTSDELAPSFASSESGEEHHPNGTQGFLSGVKQSAKKLISARKTATLKDKIKKEPRIKPRGPDDQLQMPFSAVDDQAEIPVTSPTGVSSFNAATAKPESISTGQATGVDANQSQGATSAPSEEVLVVNVFAAEGNVFQGASLLPVLLTLHFKFGEQDIFHRHAENTGRGPILFSLANALKPGTFDLDNMEQFSTEGISLFMILPLAEAQQAFNMMLNSANKIATELDGRVLDDQRGTMTQPRIKHYIDRIREFERLQLIARGGDI